MSKHAEFLSHAEATLCTLRNAEAITCTAEELGALRNFISKNYRGLFTTTTTPDGCIVSAVPCGVLPVRLRMLAVRASADGLNMEELEEVKDHLKYVWARFKGALKAGEVNG